MSETHAEKQAQKHVMPALLPRQQSSFAARVLERSVRLYQLTLASLVPGSCRFEPSCSSYARQAFIDHGAAKGTALTVGRLARCHPWCEGGYDPVPHTACQSANTAAPSSPAPSSASAP